MVTLMIGFINEFQPLGATPSNVQDSDENDNSEYYMVENAIYQRDSNQGKQYFVKWKIFPTSSNSWVNESDLNEAFLEYVKKTRFHGNQNDGNLKRRELIYH